MSVTHDPIVLVDEGKKAYERGDFAAAAGKFRESAQLYAAKGDKLSEAESLNNCGVALLRCGNGKAALEAIQGTPETFAAVGDTRRQGLALGNFGDALESTGQKKEAALMYERSADLLESAGETEMRAHVLQALSKLQLRSGRQIEALATMEAGISGIEKPTLRQRVLKKLIRLPFKMLK